MSEILKHKIRRDLNRWSRKLLLCIGLENIGRELVGEVKWEQIYPLQQVWQQAEASDFDPTAEQQPEESTVELNNDTSQIDPSETVEEEANEEKNDLLDNIIHFLPYWYFINRAFGVSGNALVPEDLGQIRRNNSNSLLEIFDNQRLLFLQSLEQQQQQTQCEQSQGLESSFLKVQNLPFQAFNNLLESVNNNVGPNVHSSESNSKSSSYIPHSLSLSVPFSDEPLDLTQRHKKVVEDEEMNTMTSSTHTISDGIIDGTVRKSVRNAQSKTTKIIARTNQRTGKGYTTEELEAALKDIQSGKLGTRRAAVIYGIPRSTLRNKVYKLGKERNRTLICQRAATERLGVKDGDTTLQESSSGVSGDLFDNHQALKLDSELIDSNSNLNPLHTGFNPYYSLRQNQRSGSYNNGNLEKLNLEDGISHEKKVLKEWLRTKLSRQNINAELQNESFMCNDASAALNLNCISPVNSSDEEHSDISSQQETRQDVILKIPSILNNNSISNRLLRKRKSCPDDPGMSHSNLRTTSNRSVEENSWKQRKINDGTYNSPYDSEIDSNNVTHINSIDEHSVEVGLEYMSQNSFSKSLVDSEEKKSRPKRGKYRNYDRDALLKAVKAVQNGEMSVHRAGSYYGVPHSTLEYKVKERHLLRRPKRKVVGSPKSNQRSSPESSVSGSEATTSRQDETSAILQMTCDSNGLPLPSDLRESLSRYLNINASLGPYSPPSSPETLNEPETSRYGRNENCDSGHISPMLNTLSTFPQLGATVGSSRENNCLDLSKKF